jgi:hypothetical protein
MIGNSIGAHAGASLKNVKTGETERLDDWGFEESLSWTEEICKGEVMEPGRRWRCVAFRLLTLSSATS